MAEEGTASETRDRFRSFLHKPGFPWSRRIAGQTVCRVSGCRHNGVYCWRCWR